ncbi:MAG: tetratricopeptide repeat protein [Proteobacteria bacterium]|nr:tetratricopeptide repeat protein [Pseudomonadota bacterium]
MKSYHTVNSTDGLRLPHSGFVIGRLAHALRLKTALREDWNGASYKTVQRYFKGDRIAPETVELILDALVESLVPRGLKLPDDAGLDLTLHDLISNSIRFYAQRWDHFVAEVNSHVYPVQEESDLPIPVLRLVMLDLGIRLGAWGILLELRSGEIIEWGSDWLKKVTIGALIDKRRHDVSMTVADLAHKVGVSEQSIEAWRGGHSFPTSNHLEKVARTLSKGGDRSTIEYQLRLAVGVQAVHRHLMSLCGEERINDMVEAMLLTAKHVHDRLIGPVREEPPPEFRTQFAPFDWDEKMEATKAEMRPRLWNLVFHGARCPTGEFVTFLLAEVSALNQEVSADFLGLSGDWSGRVHHWMQVLGSAPRAIEYLRHHVRENWKSPPDDVEMLGRFAIEMQLRMAGYDFKPPADWQTIRISPDPFGKAMNRALQAERASSVDDHASAIEHYRHAVNHQPLNASLHFKLGAALWQQGLRGDPDRVDMALVEEALLECRMAVQLDPEFGNARNEIGIILSNIRRSEGAEAAFAEAEPYHGHHSHHWFCRGNNLIALGRLQDAKHAFERAIELTKDGVHVRAMIHLAAIFMALGEKHKARRLGNKVEHMTGEDPVPHWKRILRAWDYDKLDDPDVE